MYITPVLRDLLHAPSIGSEVQLFGNSFERRLNAVDGRLAGQFSTGVEALEDKSIRTSLGTMQALFDTDAVSRVVVMANKRSDADQLREHIAAELERQAPGRFEVTTWNDPRVGPLYASLMGFMSVVFGFTFVLLSLIALLTVQYTVVMNIADRQGEIGLMRALGYGRWRLAGLLALELAYMTLAAIAIAWLLLTILDTALGWTGATTDLPRVSEAVALRIHNGPGPWIIGVLVTMTLVISTAAIAAWRQLSERRIGNHARLAAIGWIALSTLCSALALTAPSSSYAAASSRSAPPDEQTMVKWLRDADMSRGGWGSYRWKLTIVSTDRGKTTETGYDVSVADGRALARTTEPRRYQGERILIDDRSMWYFKPSLRKPVSISPQQRLVGEAANGDIAATQYARDYRPSYQGEAVIDGVACHKLQLVASAPTATYERIIYYVSADTNLGVRAEFLTSNDQPLKIATFRYDQQIDVDGARRPFVSQMKIVSASRDDSISDLQYSDIHAERSPRSMFSIDGLTSD